MKKYVKAICGSSRYRYVLFHIWVYLNTLRDDVDSQYKKGLKVAKFKGASAGLLTVIFCGLAIALTSNTGSSILDIAIVYAIYFLTLIGIILGIHVIVTCLVRSDEVAVRMLKELAKGADLYKWIN